MTIPSRSYQPESWNEYKMLVLAELERLNDCVEKLRDRHDNILHEHDKILADRISELSKNFAVKLQDLENNVKISDIDIDKKFIESVRLLGARIKKLEDESLTNTAINSKQGRIAFWTAVITIFSSLVTSIISLIISLS